MAGEGTNYLIHYFGRMGHWEEGDALSQAEDFSKGYTLQRLAMRHNEEVNVSEHSQRRKM